MKMNLEADVSSSHLLFLKSKQLQLIIMSQGGRGLLEHQGRRPRFKRDSIIFKAQKNEVKIHGNWVDHD